MASMSLEPAVTFDSVSSPGAPRHGRKHSRHPTAATPLPSFTFNPGSPVQQGVEAEKRTERNDNDVLGSGHIRRPSKPSPLPEFVFNPGASIPAERTPSPTHPILEEMALNQQRVSKSAKPAPLPAFTFNPGAVSGSASPAKSDLEAEGSKFGGHRRGGSEFVGGKADNAQLVTPGLVKHEARPSGALATGTGYRGHTHRRSQAISISDIDTSDLIKQHALAKARGPSNPTTPQESTFAFPRASPGQRHTPSAARSPPGSPRRRGSTPGYRPRTVDFSEKVDVIPRPLSMISSETERSNSTIRGHSLTNSINSIASPPALNISEPLVRASPQVTDPVPSRRPNTADASLLLSSATAVKEQDLLTMPKRPLSASGSPGVSAAGSPPPKKKHFWSAHGNDPSPTPTPRVEQKDPMDVDLSMEGPTTDPSIPRPKTAPERPTTQKRRVYHTWTAGIFSKKSKRRTSKKSRRSPTPPSLLRRDSDNINDIFDADDTVVLREDSPIDARKQAAIEQNCAGPVSHLNHTELSSPMLDLDAALDDVDDRRHSDDHSRTTTARIAKLHSSERRGIVDAFGVSHRRTESAPALSPVNRSTLFGMRHHGSNSSLSGDVFDEEEEDNFLAHEKEAKSHSTTLPPKEQRRLSAQHKEGGLGLTNVPSHADDVLIVDPDATEDEDVRSSKSTIAAPSLTVEEILKRPSTSPMPFAYPDHQLHYASSTEGRTTSASLISSPDADHVSFEVQTRPRRLGDLHPDMVRPSTDDLPSLSDSVSSNAYPRGSCSGNTRPSLEQRSNSMFVPGSSRLHESWKRSSLASLNRLIPGSSHGSKLKLETVCADGEEKSRKKSNRISKLMRFWRSKEAEDTPTTSS